MSDQEKRIENGAALIAQDYYGGQLYRNNNGKAFNKDTGQPVHFGLGNTSTKVNRTYKSSDQIGIIPVTITQEMVGKKIGVFTAIEDKKPGWVLSANDAHGQAQANFINHIKEMGGIAGFITHPDHVHCHIQEFIKCLCQK